MLNNADLNFEDPCQKRERLKTELFSAINEVEDLFGALGDDLNEPSKAIKEKLKKVKEFQDEERVLEESLEKKRHEMSELNLMQKDENMSNDGSQLLEELNLLHERSFSLDSMTEVLMSEIESMIEGGQGVDRALDDGVMSLKKKLERIEEIKGQLKQLEYSMFGNIIC